MPAIIRRSIIIRVLLFFLLCCNTSAIQSETLDPQAHHLSTHVTHLPEDASQLPGFSFQALAVNDSWGNVRGGVKRGVGVVGNLNLKLEVDSKEAGWWDGGRFVVYGIGVYGRRPSLSVGDYQYTSSIDAFDTIEPYEIFYEQDLSEDGNLLVGIHDFSTEFAVLSYGAILLNSSFATPATITQLPYSFYPFTGLGMRIHLHFAENFYLLSGVYDGKPARQGRARSRDLGLSSSDGAYAISELGFESGPHQIHSKIAIGAWYRDGAYTDMNSEVKTSNAGSFLVAERQLWQESQDADQGVGAFLQLGHASADRNFNNWYFGTGINYRGLLEDRPLDTLSLAFNFASTSPDYRSQTPETDVSERVIECAYRMQLNDSLTITPDFQWVVNPGARTMLDNSAIFFIRSELAL